MIDKFLSYLLVFGMLALGAWLLFKKCVLNVVAFNPDELVLLVLFAIECGVDEVEINLSCPNRWEEHGGKQEPIICFSPQSTDVMLSALGAVLVHQGVSIPVWVKISLFTDYAQLENVAHVVSRYARFVVGITSANTAPNGWVHQGANGLAIPRPSGLAGSDFFRALVLGNVDFLTTILPPSMRVSGVGGISDAVHIVEYFQHGAKEIQIATAYREGGNEVLEKHYRAPYSHYSDTIRSLMFGWLKYWCPYLNSQVRASLIFHATPKSSNSSL